MTFITKWLVFNFFAVLVFASSGCISSVFFSKSGNSDGKISFPKTKYHPQNIIFYEEFPAALDEKAILTLVQKSLDVELNQKTILDDMKKDQYTGSIPFQAHSVMVLKFSGADNDEFRQGPGVICIMGVGCTCFIGEAFDPIILPFAVYSHVASYRGERYFTIFFDRAGQPIMAFNFDVFSGEQARPPFKSWTNNFWFNILEFWYPKKYDKKDYHYWNNLPTLDGKMLTGNSRPYYTADSQESSLKKEKSAPHDLSETLKVPEK